MAEEISIREHRHLQQNPYQFRTVLWAPEKGTTKARFAIESSIYITAYGWDVVDPMTRDNAYMIAFKNYVRMKELQGYIHIGHPSMELEKMMYNLWGKGEDKKNDG